MRPRLPHRVRTHFWHLWRAVEDRSRVPMKRRLRYVRTHHRLPNLRNPVTFTEKVNWRILYDRRPILAPTCDKLWMKEYASAHGVHTPKTLWAGTDIAELADTELPQHWVLKPNHRSGLVYLGSGAPDRRILPEVTKGWLAETLARDAGEWAYSQARRCLLVEERLGNPMEDLLDYKFFVFDGEVRLVQVAWRPEKGCVKHRYFWPDWQDIPVRREGYEIGPDLARPSLLGEMLEVARSLGQPFDFIRVDLYVVDGLVWLGELTPYPSSGMAAFQPWSFDVTLGSLWTLPIEDVRDHVGDACQTPIRIG